MPKVLVERDGPVLVVTLNRPEVRNAIDGETAELLSAAWDRLRDDAAVRVGVLTGAGTAAFSSGADLKALDTLRELPGGWLGITRRLDVGKPVVAAVRGHCLAGGLELALVADLRIASPEAVFGVTNRKWGVPLVDGGTQRLPRIVGEGRAMEMILTGRLVYAPEALAWGLVNEVVPANATLARAIGLAKALAELPQSALRADRASVLAGVGLPLPEAFAEEARLGGRVLEEPEFAEAAKRFAARKR